MSPPTDVDAFRDAWCRADADTAAASVTSFSDPDTGGSVRGSELAEHARGWFARFPGTMSYEVHGYMAPWRLTALHRASYHGIAATGMEVVVEGVDTFVEREDGVHVRRYFDRVQVVGCLGHESRFVPQADGHRLPGTGTCTPGRPGTPEVLVLTWLDVRDDEESAEVDQLATEVVKSLRTSSGFLGMGTFDVGRRKYTLTAFDRLESVRSVHARPHQRAVRRLLRGGLCTGAYTGIWSPVRESRYTRCPDCRVMTAAGEPCGCGPVPAPDALFTARRQEEP